MYSSYIKVNKLVWRFKKAHEAVTLWGYQDTWLNKAVALSLFTVWWRKANQFLYSCREISLISEYGGYTIELILF